MKKLRDRVRGKGRGGEKQRDTPRDRLIRARGRRSLSFMSDQSTESVVAISHGSFICSEMQDDIDVFQRSDSRF